MGADDCSEGVLGERPTFPASAHFHAHLQQDALTTAAVLRLRHHTSCIDQTPGIP